MNWGSFGNFIHMGGYGFFVWSSYGVCAAVVAIDVISAYRRRRRALAEVSRETRIAEQRRSA